MQASHSLIGRYLHWLEVLQFPAWLSLEHSSISFLAVPPKKTNKGLQELSLADWDYEEDRNLFWSKHWSLLPFGALLLGEKRLELPNPSSLTVKVCSESGKEKDIAVWEQEKQVP